MGVIERRRPRACAGLLLATICLSVPAWPVQAQDVYAYPTRGQSSAQQNQDRYECHSWAVNQTGFDPSRQAAQPVQAGPPPPQGEVLRGAGRGAAIGAVGGAIGGDAGKGAAIGAASGALIGGMRRRENARQQYNAQAQQSAAMADQQRAYSRAMAACLQGRGYTVN